MDFTKTYQLKGLKPKKQSPHELLRMLWFDEKIHLLYILSGGLEK